MKTRGSLRSGGLAAVSCIILSAVLSGCAPTQAARNIDARDPWEGWNRRTQAFNDRLDDYFMKPLARGYQFVTPTFVNRGITNFFSNMEDIGVTLNDLLQLKARQGGMDSARFLVNTTAGIGGFIDVAGRVGLPKHNEDFDQTLAFWGVPSGPYLVLPLLGPQTPRGTFGLLGDAAVNPTSYAGTGIGFGTFAARMTDTRADNLSATKIMDESSVDRYEFMRNAYFQQRSYLQHDGNPPEDDDLDLDVDNGTPPKGKVDVYLDAKSGEKKPK